MRGKMLDLSDVKLGVIGLGCVGLPLAVEFDKHYHTVGFDIDVSCVAELRAGHDHTLEVNEAELAEATRLIYTDKLEEIATCNTYIVTVPTLVDIINELKSFNANLDVYDPWVDGRL